MRYTPFHYTESPHSFILTSFLSVSVSFFTRKSRYNVPLRHLVFPPGLSRTLLVVSCPWTPPPILVSLFLSFKKSLNVLYFIQFVQIYAESVSSVIFTHRGVLISRWRKPKGRMMSWDGGMNQKMDGWMEGEQSLNLSASLLGVCTMREGTCTRIMVVTL